MKAQSVFQPQVKTDAQLREEKWFDDLIERWNKSFISVQCAVKGATTNFQNQLTVPD
jgi:hypothetical protein